MTDAIDPTAVLDTVRAEARVEDVDPALRPLVALVRLCGAWAAQLADDDGTMWPSRGNVGGQDGYWLQPADMTATQVDAAALAAAVDFLREVTAPYSDNEEPDVEGLVAVAFSCRSFLRLATQFVPQMLPDETVGRALERITAEQLAEPEMEGRG